MADDGRVYLDAACLAKYLSAFSKDGHNFDPSSYSLSLSFYTGDSIGICQDANYAYVLSKRYDHDFVTAALMGFDINDFVADIRQIQGAYSRHYALKPFRWERMLLRIALDEFSEEGFSQARIQPAEKNKYWLLPFPDDGRRIDIEEHRSRLRLRYNVTARRSGFRFDEQLGCYVRDL